MTKIMLNELEVVLKQNSSRIQAESKQMPKQVLSGGVR